MKLKQIIFAFMAGVMLITGCHDSFLTERVYSNIIPLNFYKTENDAQAALVSVYNVMRSANAFQRQIILAAECPGEASWPNNSGEAWRTELDQFTWTTSSPGFRQVWAELYMMVNRANTVLELCGEGHAWFDMKRMDLMKKRITKYQVEDKHYVFPIPQNEMDVNPQLEQNNGY